MEPGPSAQTCLGAGPPEDVAISALIWGREGRGGPQRRQNRYDTSAFSCDDTAMGVISLSEVTSEPSLCP